MNGLLERDRRTHYRDPEHELALGGLRFHFIPVSHSIPQGYALAVIRQWEKVVHTGDFKIDEFPSDGVGTDLPALRSFAGTDGVRRCCFPTSTNAESEGHTSQRKWCARRSTRFFGSERPYCHHAFSSHIERIQMVFDMAREFDRAVVVSGRSLVNNIERGRDLGFMRMPPELFTDQTIPDVSLSAWWSSPQVLRESPCPRFPALRPASTAAFHHGRRHGDHVFRVIPGNARANRLINQMYRMGADVCHDGTRPCTFPVMVGATSSAPCSTPYAPNFRADSRRVPPFDSAPRFGP